MAERARAHCKKHRAYEPLCTDCIKFDEILESSLEVVHPSRAHKRKFRREESSCRPPGRLDEWAQSMVEAAAARKKAVEEPPVPPADPAPKEEP